MDQNRPMREDNDFSQMDTGATIVLPPTNSSGTYPQMNSMYSGNGAQPVGGSGTPQWQVGPQTQGTYGAAQGRGIPVGPQTGPQGMGMYGAAQGPGAPFGQMQQNVYQGPQGTGTPPPQKNMTAVIIAVIAAVLLLGGVIFAVYYFVLRDKKEDKTTDSSTTVAVEEDLSGVTAEEPGTTAGAEQEGAVSSNTVPTTAVPPTNPTSATVPATYASPVMSYATTVRGDVLEGSNVNSNRSFGADKLIDGYADTCWCVNTESDGGVGATVTIVLRETSLVSGIGIINGNLYMPQDDIYRSNGQLRDFTLTFSDNSTMRFTASNNSNASNNYQYFAFSSPVVTDRITLRVDSAYVGEKYTTNVCIGEITVY